MKKILSIFLLASTLLMIIPQQIFANNNERFFVVTAYYSPLPDQKFYLKGNYEAEIRLNGRWIAGASGKKVFSGMLAAPKNYSFWTKIYLEWLGIGSVEDRGGAIVNAWKRWYHHDRIDVWMWYGDEWLRRALYWGKRTVKWSFVSKNSQTNIDYNTIPAPYWATNSLDATPGIFYKSIGKNSSETDIYALKAFLSEHWLYTGDINGVYSSDLIDMIHKFQLDNNILKAGEYHGAWYWWKQTRSTLLSLYKSGKIESIENQKIEKPMLVDSVDNQIFLSSSSTQKQLEYNPDNIFTQAVSTQQEISSLQMVLKELELYKWDITWNYDDIMDIIVNFQIENNLIESSSSIAAGYYGPKTRETLYDAYLAHQNFQKRISETKHDIKEFKDDIFKASELKVMNLWNLSKWDVSPQVRELQIILKDLGYFDYDDTAIFGAMTTQAIIDFQLDSWVIESSQAPGAGLFWPRTKSMLMEKIYQKEVSNQFDISIYDEKIIKELEFLGVL